MLQMSQHYEPELSAFILKRDVPLKALLQNTAYRMQVFQIGQINSVMNAKQTKKPKPIIIT